MRSVVSQLPAGVIAESVRLWDGAWHHSKIGPDRERCDEQEVSSTIEFIESELSAPIRLEPQWPPPLAPRPVGQGHIHADIVDEEIPLIEAMLSEWNRMDAESVAVAAQELRWPVVPYRQLPTSPPKARSQSTNDNTPRVSVGQLSVVDMTTHWAGPLATKLLADHGATVIKVDPNCRPDGMRARPGLYQHLNGSKDLVDLDLRHDADRSIFESMLEEADVLVESFSRRVLPNFGYAISRLAKQFPRLSIVSVKSFDIGSAEASWLAYGSGIHAASGLGLTTGTPKPSPLPYPDFLAGLTTFGTILQSVSTRTRHAEVSLMASVAPLVAVAVEGSTR